MKSDFNKVSEIISAPCDECDGAGFAIFSENGDVEILACDCPEATDQFLGKDNN